MDNYSYLEKVLHRLMLGDTAISNEFYNQLLFKSKNKEANYTLKNVFITGLARSGTTALLNKIFSSGEVSSLLYKYMPFILSPKIAKLYSKLVNKNHIQTKSRAHNDGIKININSPECLDEVFWIKTNQNIENEKLTVKAISDDILRAYSYLINSFSLNNKKIMLIKNNNNHLRLEYLAEFFKDSVFFVMFRDPISQASSLLSQHLNFLKLQKKDPFILEYMNLIGHFEFGTNAIPFIYPTDQEEWYFKNDKTTIDYWIKQWIHSYQWILKSNILLKKNIHLISYEDLCNHKSLYKKICDLIKVSNMNTGLPFTCANIRPSVLIDVPDKSIINEALDIYNQLQVKSL